jgi:hypothetical protein
MEFIKLNTTPKDIDAMTVNELFRWFKSTRNPLFAEEYLDRTIAGVYEKHNGHREHICTYYKQQFDALFKGNHLYNIENQTNKSINTDYSEITAYVRKRVIELYTTPFTSTVLNLQKRLNRIALITGIAIFILTIIIILLISQLQHS